MNNACPHGSLRNIFVIGWRTSSVIVDVDNIPSQQSSTQFTPPVTNSFISRSDEFPDISFILSRFSLIVGIIDS